MSTVPSPIVTQEIHIVSSEGDLRILLSAASGKPFIRLMQPSGKAALELALDEADRPAVQLFNPNPAAPTATLQIDDKGAHVKFDRAGGASSYVFLNNAGASGIVLSDAQGVRQLEAVVAPDGTVRRIP
jgi:hypothetical protein